MELYNIKNPKNIECKDLFMFNTHYLHNVLYKDIQEDWFSGNLYYPKYYNVFSNIIETENLDNLNFFEIGVRTGYIGNVLHKVSELHNIPVHYTGMDINQYERNGLDLARECFEFIGLPHTLKIADSTIFNFSRYENIYDVVHIDGDHSYDTKITDFINSMLICKNGGYILIDDYDHHSEVRRAVDFVMAKYDRNEYWYLDTLRGLVICKVKKD